MRWQPENIAWFAIDAGWPRPLLAEVVARAMVTSEGDDTWSWPDPPGQGAVYTGLWGADTSGWDATARAWLHRPAQAARDALWRYQRDGDWSGFVTVNLGPVLADYDTDLAAAIRDATPVRPLASSPEGRPWLRTLEAARDAALRTLAERGTTTPRIF